MEAFGRLGLDRTRRIGTLLDFGEVLLGGCDGQLQLGLVRRETLVADDRLARRRLEPRDLVAVRGRPAIALHGVRARGLDAQA